MSWIELMTTDQGMAKDFYPAVLGVAGRDVEFAPGVVYTLLEVTGQSVAGVMAAPDDNSRWFCYFAVEDCDAVADQALALGGTQIIRGDTPAGRFAFLTDPQGGTFRHHRPQPGLLDLERFGRLRPQSPAAYGLGQLFNTCPFVALATASVQQSRAVAACAIDQGDLVRPRIHQTPVITGRLTAPPPARSTASPRPSPASLRKPA